MHVCMYAQEISKNEMKANYVTVHDSITCALLRLSSIPISDTPRH